MRYPGPQRLVTLVSLLAALAAPFTCAWSQATGMRPALNADAPDKFDFPDEAPGIRAGGFHVLPSAAVSIAYDSNIFAAPAPRTDDVVSMAEATVRLENDPGGPVVAAEALVRARRFMDAHDQNTTEFSVSATLDEELSAQDELFGGVLVRRRFESREDVETPNFRRVSFYKESRGALGYAHTFNRFALHPGFSARRLDYEDASQRFRDRWSYRGELRSTYRVSPAVSLLGTGYYGKDDYRFPSPRVASAETTGALVGARVILPEIADFELAGGYFRRDVARQADTVSGLSVRASMTVQPTRLTTVRASLVRQDLPTRINGAFSKVRTDTSLEVLHEYSRTLNLYARARMIQDDFESPRRTDKSYLTEAGANWLLSRWYVLSASYDHAARNTVTVGESFGRHTMSLSLIGRF